MQEVSLDPIDQINNLGPEPGNLGDALPWQIKRVTLIHEFYLTLPDDSGKFAAYGMKLSIDAAVAAQSRGDVIEMLATYKDLQGYEL